ncbi:hypothetical protein ES705_39656 [subsurface metagenome]
MRLKKLVLVTGITLILVVVFGIGNGLKKNLTILKFAI